MTIVREIQQWDKSSESMKFVWWIPTEYWELASVDNPAMTEAAIQEINSIVEDYTIVAAFDGKVTTYGFRPADTLIISLIDDNGKEYQPIPTAELPDPTVGLLSVLKPVLSNIIGQMGKNMEFFVFPAYKKGGRRITDPSSDNPFTISLNEALFNWKLPLASFVPPKTCPVDNEQMNGTWKYCPHHGDKLNN